jgi:glutamate/tyrosine decarboxylase-like PLP-dependent enzyme
MKNHRLFNCSNFKFSSKSKIKYKVNTKFIDSVYNQLKKYLIKMKRKESKVIDFKTPKELKKIIPFEISDTKKTKDNQLLKYTQKIIDYSVHSGNHNYHNTLFGGFDERALVGEYIASTLNGSVYTYEIAPVYTLMEEEVAKKYCQLLRWKGKNDFIFCPGGSYANFYGITTARAHKFPEYKKIGLNKLPQMKVFYSENGHYSIQKAGILCGFGLDNIIKVKADKQGKMDVKELELAIERETQDSSIPLAVISTLGTTVLGEIDPITEIGKICKKREIWHHVDACLGSGMIFFNKFHRKEPGLEYVDSISIDPHKVLNIPLQCSVFLTRHEGILQKGNSTNASYLFMKDKELYDASLDKGDKSFQCGRHIDIVKLWLYWKYHSTLGIKEQIKGVIENAKYLSKLIKKHDNFELVFEPSFNNVCFYYIPNRLLNQIRNSDFYEEIGKIAPKIKAEMVRRGNLMLAYQSMNSGGKSYPNFFRPSITVGKDHEDMKFIIEEIHKIGKNL